MHDGGFVKYLQSSPSSKQLLDDALWFAEQSNESVEKIIPSVFEEYKKENHIILKDIEITD